MENTERYWIDDIAKVVLAFWIMMMNQHLHRTETLFSYQLVAFQVSFKSFFDQL